FRYHYLRHSWLKADYNRREIAHFSFYPTATASMLIPSCKNYDYSLKSMEYSQLKQSPKELLTTFRSKLN
ncbi:MAG: hypothetical protein MJK14_07370, partial [Rivularia sp. ALOHA_DT_140]|nr:hypothetical protein [Rivularia sp. ALOHA_DT_140]